jgi:hypothetical protein
LDELRRGDQGSWRDLQLSALEASGQAEFLNWVCLAGAITELGATAEVLDYTDSYIFNSSKCTMLARPGAATPERSGTS